MTFAPDVAAVALGVSARTVRRWVGDGTLRNYGTERSIRVSLAEVETAKTRRAMRRLLPT